MPRISHVGRVMIPVTDQDEAIAFYTKHLGCTLTADVPFGNGDRWVEVQPPNGPTTLALTPPQGEYQPGRMLGLALDSADAAADLAELKAAGVDVDEPMGGDGTVPYMFFFRDNSGNTL